MLFERKALRDHPAERALPFNVWLVQQDRSREQRAWSGYGEGVYHSQKMPPELARRMIEHAALPPTARVLDCFLGTGTVLVEAASMGIQGLLGVEVQSEYLERCARPNLERAGAKADIRVGNACAMTWIEDSSIDLVATSPPYGAADPLVDSSGRALIERSEAFFHLGMEETSFYHRPPELANGSISGKTPDAWRTEMAQIMREIRRVLKPGAYAMLALREFWDDRGMIDLPGVVIEIAPAAGLIPYDQIYAIDAAVDSHGKLTSRASVHRHRVAGLQLGRACGKGVPCVTRVVILRRRPLRAKRSKSKAQSAQSDGQRSK